MAKETPKVVKTGLEALYSCNSLGPEGGGPVKFKDNLTLGSAKPVLLTLVATPFKRPSQREKAKGSKFDNCSLVFLDCS